MLPVGQIIELWRYPVCSLGGERVESVHLSASGVDGDRGFLLFDTITGQVACPESDARWRPALYLEAKLPDAGLPEIVFPDRTRLALDAPALVPRLQAHFGFAVSVGATDLTSLVSEGFPGVPSRYAMSPVHLITTASLEALAAKLGSDHRPDRRRFRPTMVVETARAGSFLENDWVGTVLVAKNIRLCAMEGAKRCGMTLIGQPGLGEEPEILRTILRHNRRNFGIYCNVTTDGTIAVGETLSRDD